MLSQTFISTGSSLPDHWDPMPKGKPYHVVALPSLSPEYQKVSQIFQSTSPGLFRIKEISRIQNPQLYKSFIARKEAIDATQKRGSNELELFHGTSENAVANINHHGFNRSLCGKNGM